MVVLEVVLATHSKLSVSSVPVTASHLHSQPYTAAAFVVARHHPLEWRDHATGPRDDTPAQRLGQAPCRCLNRTRMLALDKIEVYG